ncbi:hypothetical protein LI328DRAFT_5778 [Trichoderma asperelloides]|nr:hypothetical protein LI328DRAFT_5778 [Trichoderma asperelloides]
MASRNRRDWPRRTGSLRALPTTWAPDGPPRDWNAALVVALQIVLAVCICGLTRIRSAATLRPSVMHPSLTKDNNNIKKNKHELGHSLVVPRKGSWYLIFPPTHFLLLSLFPSRSFRLRSNRCLDCTSTLLSRSPFSNAPGVQNLSCLDGTGQSYLFITTTSYQEASLLSRWTNLGPTIEH